MTGQISDDYSSGCNDNYYGNDGNFDDNDVKITKNIQLLWFLSKLYYSYSFAWQKHPPRSTCTLTVKSKGIGFWGSLTQEQKTSWS